MGKRRKTKVTLEKLRKLNPKPDFDIGFLYETYIFPGTLVETKIEFVILYLPKI